MADQVRMILDIDTGIDDAMAVLYALNRPGITLEGCTVVFGNIDIENATRNTLAILELAGRGDVPVAVGASRSFLKPFSGGAPHVHGANGLGNVVLPTPRATPVDEDAADYIIRMARKYPGELTLCPVGPLTNIGLAFAKAPDVATLFREVVIMGSTVFEPGIPTAVSDPNFHNDPEAARIVLRSGANLTLVGMDVTMKTLLTPPMIAEIAGGTNAAAKMMEINKFYVDFYMKAISLAGCGLHDPLAVAVCEDPSLVTVQPMNVDMELNGELTRGMTVTDRRAGAKPNAKVCMGVDLPRFTRRFIDTIKTVGK
jgi:purine nucleosidase